jgi:hypothetical protein
MYFLRLWAISALAALCALLVVLFVWLLFHLRFDVRETLDLMLSYITNGRIMALTVGLSALVGLIEAAILQFGYRRRLRK